MCDGFGKHGDSYSTRPNRRSAWDTLHPGRPWATHAGVPPNRKTPGELAREILAHCRDVYGWAGNIEQQVVATTVLLDNALNTLPPAPVSAQGLGVDAVNREVDDIEDEESAPQAAAAGWDATVIQADQTTD